MMCSEHCGPVIIDASLVEGASREDLELFKQLKAQPKMIPDVIKAFKKRKKIAANTRVGSDEEDTG